MAPGLRAGVRGWARLLPLLGPRPPARCSGARPPPPRPRSLPGLASAVGVRGLRGAARRDGADPRAERAAPGRGGARFDLGLLVSLLRQENAKDICVISVAPELKYTDYLVVVSGASPRHLQAMAQYLVSSHKFLKARGEPFARIEGQDAGDWLCVDFGSMVIHLMLPGIRENYELEKLWTLGIYDDQLAQMAPESLPEDFILGFPPNDELSECSPLEAKSE